MTIDLLTIAERERRALVAARDRGEPIGPYLDRVIQAEADALLADRGLLVKSLKRSHGLPDKPPAEPAEMED